MEDELKYDGINKEPILTGDTFTPPVRLTVLGRVTLKLLCDAVLDSAEGQAGGVAIHRRPSSALDAPMISLG